MTFWTTSKERYYIRKKSAIFCKNDEYGQSKEHLKVWRSQANWIKIGGWGKGLRVDRSCWFRHLHSWSFFIYRVSKKNLRDIFAVAVFLNCIFSKRSAANVATHGNFSGCNIRGSSCARCTQTWTFFCWRIYVISKERLYIIADTL